ncbi:hypothetical protein DOY81_012884 [Sarcophaga bullata]|nr:hypothetical protein DOY81_012884 [Sarcophaga bullata]
MTSSNQEVVVAPPVDAHNLRRDKSLWRDLTSYWILGLCNNYGYVDSPSVGNEGGNGRECHIVSTGAILLADILPSLFVKIIMPFFPFWVQ